VKIVAGLGNPGPEYDDTRHNAGWWMLDRLAHDWRLGPFQRDKSALVASGYLSGQGVTLVKPMTYMNRSGGALVALLQGKELDPRQDLLVIVDDAALDVGRVRLRPRGSAGGHNGLASVIGALGTEEFSRLRIGVGKPPPEESMIDWVLSPMPAADEDVVLGLLPELTEGVRIWIEEGAESSMSRINR
jgi:PTH1 family peptidyl-tRNA hydrolase